jgi:hypothetical protein
MTKNKHPIEMNSSATLGTFDGKPAPKVVAKMVPASQRAKSKNEKKNGEARPSMMTEVDYWVQSKHTKPKCYTSHPPLPIQYEGETYYVRGGSCLNHPPEDTTVFIGFDQGMRLTTRRYPWEPGHEIHYPIPDMGVPHNASTFKAMVKWIAEQVVAGEVVYMGCIGGHGRTGLVMSALVHEMTGEIDATTYVRKHYCKKAVESTSQVNWLNKHFGIKPVTPTKSSPKYSTKPTGGSWSDWKNAPASPTSKSLPWSEEAPDGRLTVTCLPTLASIHGDNDILSTKSRIV